LGGSSVQPFNTNRITVDGNLTVYDDGTGNYGIITCRTLQAASVTGLGPSGDTTGVTDTAAIQGLLNAGNVTVILGAGKFYINKPITIPPYCALVGQPNTTQVSQTDGGTVLVPVSGFTGLTITDGGPVTLTAAIVLLGQSYGGYSTVSEEQKIRNLMIDGSSAPASVNGIQSYGRLQRVHLSEVLISKVTGDGLVQTLDVAANQPDAWFAYKVFSRFNSGKGFNLRSADSTWYMCLSSNNGDTGTDWFINTTSNSKYYACRSEHSAGIGFGFVCTNSGNSSGDVLFQGCSTDQSTQHGFQIGGTINGVASFVHATPVVLNGCVLRRDGANGGSGGGGFAGIYIADYGSVVVVDGCNVFPGVNDDGSGTNSPQIGLLADSGSQGVVSGSYFHAATTAITDNAGLNYDNTVVIATGTTGSPTINTSPNVAAYQGKSITLTPGASPTSDPISIVSAGSGQRAFGVVVSGGGSNDRFKLTSDGKVAFGPGTTTQDVSINRPSAGILSVTDSGSGGNAMMRVAASTSQASATELFSAVCNASGDVAYIAKVNGDTQNRLRVDSNGQHQWGSGSAAADCQLDRQAANILEVQLADFDIATAGKGLRVKEGSNAKQGTATLTAGSVVVSNTSVTANSRIFLTSQADGGTPGFLRVSTRTAGTSFTITSSSGTDTSTVAYQIFEPG
jgi:hypothetical protein